MKRSLLIVGALIGAMIVTGCKRHSSSVPTLKASAFGAAIVESSGGKQVTMAGSPLPQPVVVQVNDEQGNAVTGALVELTGPAGVTFDPSAGLTDSSGQLTSNVSLGGMAGRYQIVARTANKAQKAVELKIEEIALDYQEGLGRQLNEQYCDRCHNPESTAERVSNYDNLEVKPHPFSEGDVLNKMSDADVLAIIGHGGSGLNKSPLMPAYGYTLGKAEMQALLAYIRAVADPPYHSSGMVYAKR
jgi:mono/diheme cytochrome c family protein